MERKRVTISDGVSLSFAQEGTGHPLVMIHGWSQSAAQFKNQLAPLSKTARVIAIDMRGHGESDTPDHGYRIQRLAKDLFEFITALDLEAPDLLGHSMGCSIIWSYLSMFEQDLPPRKLVFVDQAPALVAQANWSDEDKSNYGCLFPDFDALTAFEQQVIASDTIDTGKEIIRAMFTDTVGEDRLAWVTEQNLRLPRDLAAEMLHDHSVLDWRTEIQRITRPTLAVGGEASILPAQAQRWIASQVPNADLEIFEADQGGSHFMFYENPDRFNARVADFLASPMPT